jgi:hypothetical protein
VAVSPLWRLEAPRRWPGTPVGKCSSGAVWLLVALRPLRCFLACVFCVPALAGFSRLPSSAFAACIAMATDPSGCLARYRN